MTGQRSIWWLGDDVVVLRGASVRRAYAAMTMAVRDARQNARRNGTPLPEEMVEVLHVLRLAAEAARGRTAAEIGAVAEEVGSVQVPSGSAVWLASVPPADDRVVGASLMADQVAESLGISVEYARRLCRTQFRTARLVGRRWRVSAAEVEAFATARSEERSA